MADPSNPYLPDKLSTLGMMLTGLGSGIGAAASRNLPFYFGVAPGAEAFQNSYNNVVNRGLNYDLARKNYELNAGYKNMQERQIDLQSRMIENQLGIQKDVMEHPEKYGLTGTGGSSSNGPGFNVQPPVLGPGSGPTDNNIGNVRPNGQSTGFQTVPDFNSGVALTVNNARAYPKAFNGGQPMSITQIAQRWAPTGDGANDPNAWAFTVSRGSGLDPNQPLDLSNPQIAAQFARGVHLAEKGNKAVRPVSDYLPGASAGAPPQAQPQAAPQPNGMPPMPGPPPDTSRLAMLGLAGPTYGALGTARAGYLNKLQEDAWKRYNAQVEQFKTKNQIANNPVNLDANGNPVINPTIPAAAKAKSDAEKHYAEASAPYKTSEFQSFVMSLPMVDRANIQSALNEGKFDDVRKLVTDAQGGIPWENRSLHGQDFVKTLPPGTQNLMSGLLDGSISVQDLPNRAQQAGIDTSRVNLMALAKQIDPDFSTTLGPSRKAFEEDLAHGPGLVKLNALNAAPQHLSQYLDLMDALKNGNTPLVNRIVNEYRTQSGDPRATNAEALAGILAAEVAKAVKGAGTLNEAEVDRNVAALSDAHSPAQAIGIAKTWSNALYAQIKNLQERAKAYNIPEKTWQNYINPEARDALGKINSAGQKTAPPGQQTEAQTPGNMPAPKSKTEYDSLPRGTVFTAPDGSQRVKP